MGQKNCSINTKAPFDYTAVMDFVNALEAHYPFVKAEYLGTSILDRAIPILTIGSGSRAVLYVGAHHGMEWITSALLLNFFEELCHLIDTNRRIEQCDPRFFLETHTVYIVPMLNPDGVAYQIHGIDAENPLYERLLSMNGESTDFSNWQANARGVDLNHNYDAGFEEYKRMEIQNGIPCGAPTRYAGETAESEPETRALCDFIRYHDNLRGVMTLHTQGEEIFFHSTPRTPPRIRSIAKHLSARSSYRLSEADGLAAYGGLTDWCVEKMNLPAFTVECGKGINPLPFSDFHTIYATIRSMLFSFPFLL